jgi:hypothetical protein
MPIPQVSILSLSFGVLLIAGNCAALRMILGGYAPHGLVVGVFSILPMSNILAVACYRSLTRRTSRGPFLLGFGLSGALAILVCFHFCMTADERWFLAFNSWFVSKFARINRLLGRVAYFVDCFDNAFLKNAYYAVLNLSLLFSLTALPQLLVALSGGWIARRYAARSRPTIPSLPPSR